MLIAKYRKGSRTLELHHNEYHQLDDDGSKMVDSNWECIISDGRKVQFADGTSAMMFIKQNMWDLYES